MRSITSQTIFLFSTELTQLCTLPTAPPRLYQQLVSATPRISVLRILLSSVSYQWLLQCIVSAVEIKVSSVSVSVHLIQLLHISNSYQQLLVSVSSISVSSVSLSILRISSPISVATPNVSYQRLLCCRTIVSFCSCSVNVRSTNAHECGGYKE